jgi:hypothetical protein
MIACEAGLLAASAVAEVLSFSRALGAIEREVRVYS